jgi:hypothetical protein
MIRGLILAVALLAAAQARAEQSLYLKGVTTITYLGSLRARLRIVTSIGRLGTLRSSSSPISQ